MPDNSMSQLQKEFHEANGAVDILDILREEMEQCDGATNRMAG